MTEPVYAIQRATANKPTQPVPDATEAGRRFNPGKYYGTLHVITWEAPFATPEEQAEADSINRGLAGLGRVFRGVSDWGLAAYNGLGVARLQSGYLVRLFKSVTDGDIEWQGEIDYDFSKNHHGYQKGLDPREWVGMFYAKRPARLERDGQVIFGSLYAYNETGTEGDIWSIQNYAEADGYGIPLQPGDRLTVFNAVRNGDIDWEGILEFGSDALVEGPDRMSKTGWTEIIRTTKHMDTKNGWLYRIRPGQPLSPLCCRGRRRGFPARRWKFPVGKSRKTTS